MQPESTGLLPDEDDDELDDGWGVVGVDFAVTSSEPSVSVSVDTSDVRTAAPGTYSASVFACDSIPLGYSMIVEVVWVGLSPAVALNPADDSVDAAVCAAPFA